ncbi:histidine phosphatase superfamily [Calycina marina]|uniref:Histidine phosphatase superfamily n=1 Tax=Calycina marina TaxID=1763456 RepID=A0A9P7Z0D3_9HELO|nr:histidine phosphatase superfamily [Calycina marina]
MSSANIARYMAKIPMIPEHERLVKDHQPQTPVDRQRYRYISTRCLSVKCVVSFALIATVIVALMITMGKSLPPDEFARYEVITGFFQQDDPSTVPGTFDYANHNFGLIDQVYDTDADYDTTESKTQWQRFDHKVFRLNRESRRLVQYKIMFLARHGEGYHNVAESYYGTPAWNCYWSLLDGNTTTTWADAHLTSAGIAQATKANTYWKTMLATQKISTPESYYSSPLYRCLDTARITFTGLETDDRHPFLPTIKELLREGIGAHTCDRRSNKSVIANAFPRWRFEEGFSEEDELWKPLVRETESAQDARSKIVLDDIFATDSNTYIAVSTHSGEIASLLRVLGHRVFSLSTGQIIPVLVKQTIVNGTPLPTTIEPWTPVSTCSEPPPLPTAVS